MGHDRCRRAVCATILQYSVSHTVKFSPFEILHLLPFDWIGAYGGGGLIHVPSGRRICLRSDENSARYCSAGITLKNLQTSETEMSLLFIQFVFVLHASAMICPNENLCKCFFFLLNWMFHGDKTIDSMNQCRRNGISSLFDIVLWMPCRWGFAFFRTAVVHRAAKVFVECWFVWLLPFRQNSQHLNSYTYRIYGGYATYIVGQGTLKPTYGARVVKPNPIGTFR